MRALLCSEYGPPESLSLKDLDDPVPGEKQILVQIRAAGINFPDVLVIAGQYQVKTPPPFVPGNEASGVVVSVGSSVTRFKAGDEVMLMPTGGAFAELCVVDEHLAMPKSPDLTFEQAAGFTITYGTSYHAYKQCAELKPDETVLVLGAAGGVGVTAIELAKATGAKVIAAASTDTKLEFAQQAGADELINYSNVNLRNAVKELTQGAGVDVIYDPVGGELAQQALRGMAWHGRYLVIGFASGDIPAFPANLLLLKEGRLQGVWWGTWAMKHPKDHIQNMQELYALVAQQKIQPKVTESYPLDDYLSAFAAITERKALGKVVITMGRE